MISLLISTTLIALRFEWKCLSFPKMSKGDADITTQTAIDGNSVVIHKQTYDVVCKKRCIVLCNWYYGVIL